MEAKTTCHSGCSCGHNKGEEHPNVVLPIPRQAWELYGF